MSRRQIAIHQSTHGHKMPGRPDKEPQRGRYRWLLILIALAIALSILLVYAENYFYNPATPFRGGIGDHIHAMVLDLKHPNILFVGTHYGIFRTDDAGATWTSLTNGHHGLSSVLIATSITVSPVNDANVYLTGYMRDSGNAAGLLVSHDDGNTWQTLPTGGPGQLPNPRILTVQAGWAAPGECFAYLVGYGLYRTEDSGAHWQQVSGELPDQVTGIYPVTAHGQTGQEVIYAATAQGIYATPLTQPANSAPHLTFQPVPGVTGYVFTMAVSRASPPVIYAGTDQGLYRAVGVDRSFTTVSSVATNAAPVATSLAVANSQPDLLYGVTSQNVVIRSTDGGITWQESGGGLLTRNLSALQAGLRQATGNTTPVWAGGALVTQNKFLTLLQINPNTPNDVYAGVSFPVQLFHTTDGGQTWIDLSKH
jgi:photosystem II stability/assembly factor-like uncharacterized protein